MKIIRSTRMVSSHVNDNDNEREHKTPKLRDKIHTLEKIMDQLMEDMCTHGEKVARLETKMGELMLRFNEILQECQDIRNLFSSILIDIIQDRIKDTEGCIIPKPLM
jgi:predicted nuclease with TOPRIM domain